MIAIEAFYGNVGVELASIAITILIIDKIKDRLIKKNEKELVFAQLSNQNEDIVKEASKRVKKEGWLSDGSLAKRDLTGARLRYFENLTGVDLSGAILTDADFTDCELNDINFENATLQNARFVGTSLTSVRFNKAILIEAEFHGAYVYKTEFKDETQLQDAKFINTRIKDCNFTGARMDRIQLELSTFEDVICDRAKMRDSRAKELTVTRGSFFDAIFDKATLSKSVFAEVGLDGINAIYCEFEDCTISRCTVANTNFHKSHFVRAKLQNMTFRNAVFTEAELHECEYTAINADQTTRWDNDSNTPPTNVTIIP